MGAHKENKVYNETIVINDVYLKDNTTPAYYLILDSDSNAVPLTADRTLIFDVNNADRTIDLAGDLTLTGDNTVADWTTTGVLTITGTVDADYTESGTPTNETRYYDHTVTMTTNPAAAAEVNAGYYAINWSGTAGHFILNGLEGVARSTGADEAGTFRGVYGRTYTAAGTTATMRTAIGGEFSARASYSGGTECLAENGTGFIGARIWMAPWFDSGTLNNINNFWGLWIFGEHNTQRNADAAIKIGSYGGGFTVDLDLQQGETISNATNGVVAISGRTNAVGGLTIGTSKDAGDGVSLVDDLEGCVLNWAEIASGTTLSDYQSTRAIWNRARVSAAQTNIVSIYGSEAQIRVAGVNLGDGVHSGLLAYFEQDGTTVLSTPGINAAAVCTVEGSSGLTLDASTTLSGIVIDSAVHDDATINGDFDAIWIKVGGGKEPWGSDIRLQNDETISNASDGVIAIDGTLGITTGAKNLDGIVFGSLGTATKGIDFSSSGLTGNDYLFYMSGTNYWQADGDVYVNGAVFSGNLQCSRIYSVNATIPLRLDIISNSRPVLIGKGLAVGSLTGCTSNGTITIAKSSSWGFTPATGDLLYVTDTAQTGDEGFYRVVTVNLNTSIVVDRALTGSLSDVDITIYKDIVGFFATDGTNGQHLVGFSHQDKPLVIGGDRAGTGVGTVPATSHSLGGEDIMIGGKLEIDGTTYFDAPLIYGGTPTQGIAVGIIEIGDYSTPLSVVSPSDHLFPIQCNIQVEGSADKWYAPAYLKVMTDGSTAATSSNLASLLLRGTADQACATLYGVQSHMTIDNADVSSFVKAGSFKVDRGSGGTDITGEVSALQAILDGSATQGSGGGRANAFMAVVYSAVTDANEIGYFTANSSSTVSNGIYIANHGTMTNALQINSAGGTLVNGIDLLGTFSSYGLDLGGATCTTADVRFSTDNAMKFAVAAPSSGTWAQGDVVFNTGSAAGGKIGWVCTAAGTPGTWKTFGVISA